MASQGDSSSSSSTDPCAYDVFLSSRDEYNLNKFTDHLYYALFKEGIKVYIAHELRLGGEISPVLYKAIEKSRVSIIVLSKLYVSSMSCLDELVKILECKDKKQVLPVFYDKQPSELREQRCSVEEALSEHEQRFKDGMKLQRWKEALKAVSYLPGIDLWDSNVRDKFELIRLIVQSVSEKLIVKPTYLKVAEDPIGIQPRVQAINSLLEVEMPDTRMIGIFGVGGTGKTTIAKAIYDLIASKFEGCCFLANIREISKRECGIVQLQETLYSEILADLNLKLGNIHQRMDVIKERLRCKRVFLVLDDVDQLDQLETLSGKHDWFGSGSRIIITTTDKHLLTQHGVHLTYEAQELDHKEALTDKPADDFVETKDVQYHAEGVPLALSSLPSNFHPKRLIDFRKSISLISDVRMEHANLTVLNLSSCELLTKIPNLSRQSNLKELILSFCTNLEEIHDSVGLLDKLVRLDLCHCSKLWSFPRSIKLRSLEDLELGGCSSLQKFPEIKCEMKNLYRISLYGSGIKELPSSIRNISGPLWLDLTDGKYLMHLPDSILPLPHLESLSIEGICPRLIGFGEKLIEDNRQFMASIVPNREYEISGSPSTNSNISNDGCYEEAAVRASKFLSSENLFLSESNCLTNSTCKPNLSKLVLLGIDIVSLPASIKSCVQLRCLHLENCKQLQEIPELPQKIEEVHARGCISLESFPQVSKKFQFDTSDDSLDKLIWLDLSRCHKMLKKLNNPVLSPSLCRDLIGPVDAGQEIPTSWFSLLEDYVLDGIADSGRGLPTWFSHSENSLNANRCRIYVDWQECSEEAITIALCAVFVFRRPPRSTPETGKVNASVVLEGLSPRHVEGTSALIGNESTWGPQHLFLAYATVKPSELKGNHLEVKFSASTDAGAIEIASCEVHRVDEHKERVKFRKKRNENKEGARTKDGRGVLGEGTDVQMDLSKAEPENLLDLLSTIQLYQSSRKGQLGKQYSRLTPWQH